MDVFSVCVPGERIEPWTQICTAAAESDHHSCRRSPSPSSPGARITMRIQAIQVREHVTQRQYWCCLSNPSVTGSLNHATLRLGLEPTCAAPLRLSSDVCVRCLNRHQKKKKSQFARYSACIYLTLLTPSLVTYLDMRQASYFSPSPMCYQVCMCTRQLADCQLLLLSRGMVGDSGRNSKSPNANAFSQVPGRRGNPGWRVRFQPSASTRRFSYILAFLCGLRGQIAGPGWSAPCLGPTGCGGVIVGRFAPADTSLPRMDLREPRIASSVLCHPQS